MNEDMITKLLEETGAIKKGHFQLSSGLHSNIYFQCAKLLEHPKYARRVGVEIASMFSSSDIDIVSSPALGGIIVGYATADALDVPFVFAERDAGAMVLRRGFEIKPGSKVLIVEDVITTGGSANEVAKLIDKLGSEVIGIGAVVQRAEISFPFQLHTLIQMETTAYRSSDCPLCKDLVPLQSPGSKRIKKI